MSVPKLNLNYFIALSVLGSMLALWFVAPLLNILVTLVLRSPSNLFWVNGVVVLFVFVGLAMVWKKKRNLIPTELMPHTETRFRIGNIVMLAANSLVILSVLVSIFGAIFVDGFGVVVGFLVAAALQLAVPLNIAGIVCVETSRQKNSREAAQPKV